MYVSLAVCLPLECVSQLVSNVLIFLFFLYKSLSLHVMVHMSLASHA